MKNTRKKMLLSSIAMLLVALVALGSATYAWFNANPNADAQGLHMQTTSGTGLLVLSASEEALNGDFSHSTKLNAVKQGNEFVTSTALVKLTPASLSNSGTADGSANVGTFYTGNAETGSSYKLPDTFTCSPAVTGRTGSFDVYEEAVKLKVTGGANTATVYLKGLNWAIPSATYKMSETVRVAIADTDGKLVAIFAPSADGNKFVQSESALSSGNYTPTAKNDTITKVNVGTADAAGTASMKVYVYVDGEDTECVADKCSGAEIMNNLKIDLTITA